MGYKDKNRYRKTLHQQLFQKLNSMQAFGQSKKAAIEDGTYKDKIFSFNTYQTYYKHCKYFIDYVKTHHPEANTLKKARPYVNEWLQSRVDKGLSAWTVQTEAKALGKLYGISQDDKDYFTPPTRHRSDITRSRGERVRDRHFSESNNRELINFCRGIGARREGLSKLCGRDLVTKDQINKTVEKYIEKAKKERLSENELKNLKILKDAQLFSKTEYFVFLREKGGRSRISPIIGAHQQEIVERIRNTPQDDKVWKHVSSNADIHGYRSDYSNAIYNMYARPIETIPYDRINRGTGRRFQSEVYYCRKDEKGRKLDKKAMLMASKALGHNRLDIVASNYLRGL